MSAQEVDRDTVVETHARFIGQSVLFINADGTWSVGRTGQRVDEYVQVTDFAGEAIHDDSYELTAVAVEPSGTDGYDLIVQSNETSSLFGVVTLDNVGRVQTARVLSNNELFALETRLGTDINESGGIGNQLVLVDDGIADLYVDGLGAFFIKTAAGKFTALSIGGQSITWETLDGFEIEDVVPITGGYELLVRDHDDNYFEVEVQAGNTPQALSTREASEAADEIDAPSTIGRVSAATDAVRVDSAKGQALGASPTTEAVAAWAQGLKVEAVRSAVQSALSDDGKISHGELVAVMNAALGHLSSSNATQVGADLMSDLVSIGSVRSSVLTSINLAGQESGYLAYVFDKLANGSKANLTFTGGTAQAQNLGNLSAEASIDTFQKLISKWLLGGDLPNPTTQGDTANPAAKAATGQYQAFDAPLFADGAAALDVFQGSAGTCYLLAALAGIGHGRPSALDSVFVANGGTAPSWGVRFLDARGDAHWVTVNNQLVVQNAGDTEPAYAKAKGVNAAGQVVPELWAALIEKAYAQANALGIVGRENPVNAMFAIEGGLAEPLAYLLGGKASFFSDSVSTINGNAVLESRVVPEGSSALAELTKLINAGHILWVGSGNATRSPAGLTEFTGGHAFMAYDADPGNPSNTTVKIINPWGLSSADTPNATYLSPFDGDLATLVGTTGYDFWFSA